MIFISAGHNSLKGTKNYDSGAVGLYKGSKITEAELTQDFENLIVEELKKRNIKFITDYPEESLGEYLKRIKTGSGSVVLEIHFDSALSPLATGTTCIVGNDADRLDKAFAKEIVDSTANILKIKNRGVKSESQTHRGRLGLMRKEGIVALIEIGFISNEKDIEAYHTYKKELAKSYADILIRYENLQ